MFIKKISLCIILILYVFSSAWAEDLTHGLLFRSSAEPVNNRTSLSLFNDQFQKFEDTFTISFDLAIWDLKQFGYIFRAINEEDQEVDFVFVNFKGEDNLYLDFHSPITLNSVSIPIDKQDVYEKNWLHVSITFDLKADKARIFFKDRTYVCQSIGLKNPSKLKFVYGLYGLNLDVPQMAIRDINIEKQGKTAFTFPLNESRGNLVLDAKGKKQGDIINPEWVINHHYYWKQRLSLNTGSTVGVTYDPTGNRIFIFNSDSLTIYSPQYEKKEIFKINDFPLTSYTGEAIYSPQENVSYLYDLGHPEKSSISLAMIDMTTFAIKTGKPLTNSELLHHNVFLGIDGKTPYIFGGYGNYRYSNKMFSYNYDTDNWDEIMLSGDSIRPRFFAASGEGVTPSQRLIMGGFGNESGKFEHGGKHLYDLFSIDLDTKTSKKLWEIEAVSSGLVPCSNLILNQEKTHFYTLCYAHHNTKTFAQLYKFNLANGVYQIVSDSIPLISENINTTAYLFFSQATDEFYAVIKEHTSNEHSQIRIYSLLSAPVSFKDLQIHEQSTFHWIFIILPGSILVVAFGLYFWFTSRKKRKLEIRKDIVATKEQMPEVPQQKINAIYVFGDFTVYDKKGTDISYRFSAKLKSLFALILFYSNNDSSISTEMMTLELWPDKDSGSAKNTRGVTINRLRSILSDIDGISLIHQNSKWFFSFEPSFYCDYVECEKRTNLMKNDEANYDENMHRLLQILKRGTLFPNLQENWIDSFKRDFENNTEKLLSTHIIELFQNKKYAQLIHYSELYFLIDPLNEDIMHLYLKAFQKIGKAEQALILYNKFVANYRDSMGEDPKQPFPL